MNEIPRQYGVAGSALNKRHKVWVVALALLLNVGLGLRVEAQASTCEGLGVIPWDGSLVMASYYVMDWKLRLPTGQDEVTCQATARVNLEVPPPVLPGESVGRAYDAIGPIMHSFIAEGDGPFEAIVTIDFIAEGVFSGSESWPLGVVTSMNVQSDTDPVGAPTITSDNPVSLEVGQSEWREIKLFMGSSLSIMARFDDRLMDWFTENNPMGTELDDYSLTLEITLRLRRIKNQCHMKTTVSGGRGAGTYSGQVAVLSDNPTGIELESLRSMWFPGTSAIQERIESAQQAPAMQRMIANMTEQERAAYAAMQQAMGQAYESAADPNPGSEAADLIEGDEPESSDPLNELKGMWTLTLEDVMFNEQGPSVERGGTMTMAMAHIANKFVLSASLERDQEMDQGPIQSGQRPFVVSRLGIKAPGLGLASTHVDRCSVPAATLTLDACPGDQWQELDQMGAYCGTLDGQVCHENGDNLTVHSEFLAASSLEDCIQ